MLLRWVAVVRLLQYLCGPSTLQGGTRAGKEDYVNAMWRFSLSANLVGTREALFEDPQKSQEA